MLPEESWLYRLNICGLLFQFPTTIVHGYILWSPIQT